MAIILLFSKTRSLAKDIVYLILTPVKAFCPVLAYGFNVNMGWPFTVTTNMITVLVLASLTIFLSTIGLFPDTFLYILSGSAKIDDLRKAFPSRKGNILLIVLASVLVLYSCLETTTGLIAKQGTGVYLLPFLILGKDMAIKTNPTMDYFWIGLILTSALLQLAFYLKAVKSISKTIQNAVCILLVYLAFDTGSKYCRNTWSSGSTALFPMFYEGSSVFYQGFLNTLSVLTLVLVTRKFYLDEKKEDQEEQK